MKRIMTIVIGMLFTTCVCAQKSIDSTTKHVPAKDTNNYYVIGTAEEFTVLIKAIDRPDDVTRRDIKLLAGLLNRIKVLYPGIEQKKKNK